MSTSNEKSSLSSIDFTQFLVFTNGNDDRECHCNLYKMKITMARIIKPQMNN
jgi:hypothetical protein